VPDSFDPSPADGDSIVTLRLQCGKCGQPFSMAIMPVAQPDIWLWECPYPDCRETQGRDVGGNLLWVWRGHGDADPEILT
jgi:hypothetical protein